MENKESTDSAAENTYCQKAVANLRRALNASRRFPGNVFSGDWRKFLFFDSDWIFDGQFVERVKELLEIEGSKCACICNLDEPAGADRSLFLIDHKSTGSNYSAFLKGPNIGDGWLYGVDRFGCASDIGLWCIYCERRSEIGVIANRDSGIFEKCRVPIAQFKALPIDQAIAQSLSYGFSEGGLSAEWRSELVKQYGVERRGHV